MTNVQVTPQTPVFDLADRCVKARRIAGLSQEELSDRTGISISSITRYETGRTHRATQAILRQWAMACGVPYEWLRDGADPTAREGTGAPERGIIPRHPQPQAA